MEVKIIFCIFAVIAIASSFAQAQRGFPARFFNRGRGQGFRGMGRGRPFGGPRGGGRPFGGQGPPPPMMMCGRNTAWSELQALECSSYTNDINANLTQLYGNQEDEFFSAKIERMSQMRNNRGANVDCTRIKCFARELMSKIFQEGLPAFCEGRTEDAPDFSGMASLMGTPDQAVLIDNMKDGFCFGVNKKSYIMQVKIVQEQLGLPDHGMPGHGGPMRHRFREEADCENADTSTVDCEAINPDAYIDVMYGTDAAAWDAAVEQRKASMMLTMATEGPSGMCGVKACYRDALQRKMESNNGQMPSACSSLYQQRREIFSQRRFSNDKIKLISCFFAFKASINYKMAQPTLQCDTTTADNLNNLYSNDPSVVDATVQTIMNAWEEARASGRMESATISDAMVCRFKAIKDKLQQMNNVLPPFCSDEEKFDTIIDSASIQDVKELLCFKMEKLNEHMFN